MNRQWIVCVQLPVGRADHLRHRRALLQKRLRRWPESMKNRSCCDRRVSLVKKNKKSIHLTPSTMETWLTAAKNNSTSVSPPYTSVSYCLTLPLSVSHFLLCVCSVDFLHNPKNTPCVLDNSIFTTAGELCVEEACC